MDFIVFNLFIGFIGFIGFTSMVVGPTGMNELAGGLSLYSGLRSQV
jgi:hypothetical protein